MSHSNFDDEHFVVSYELLKLFQWLLVHEQESLKKLLVKSLNEGLAYELMDHHDSQESKDLAADNLQEYIIDFFTVLETLMHETINEQETTNAVQRSMIPAIYHIDTNACDSTSVALSVEKATAAVQNNTGENPKEVLCKELLRRWKPTKKPYAH